MMTRPRLSHTLRILVRARVLALALLLALTAPLAADAVDELHIASVWAGGVPEHLYWNGGQFLGWNVIPGKTVVSPPALVSYQGGVRAYVVANDQKLYQSIWNGTSWSAWVDFGGPFSSVGAAAVDYFGYLILAVVTPDNRLLLTYFDPNTNQWENYFEFAINVFGRPALAMHNGRLHFLVQGGDDDYYHQFFDGQVVSPFVDLGGPFAAGGALASSGGQLHLFGPSFSGKLFHGIIVNGSQVQGFFDLGAPAGTTVDGPPAAADYAGLALIVLVRGADNDLYGRILANGSWGAFSGSLGQAQTGPGLTGHKTGGGGGGPNHPPVFRELLSTRTTFSFGKDPAFRTGVGGQPGFSAIQPLVAPRMITLDGNGDGTLDGLDPIVLAAADLPSCCTLLVAEGATDPDGNPIRFHWQAVEGTFYSTGSEGSGGFPFGAKITDISLYDRNSVFWEAPAMIPSPVVDHLIQGGTTNVGVRVSDVPPVGQPMTSPTRFVALDYDQEIHLEVVFLGSHRLPANHPQRPNGIVMEYFASLKGSFEVGMPVAFRIDCGANRDVIDQTLIDQVLAVGARFHCPYDKDEEDTSRTVTVVASVGAAGAPFAFPLSASGLDFFRSLGCSAGDTETQVVKADKITSSLLIDVFDNGAALDDAFDLIVDNVTLGRTPPGGDKLFDVSYLISGTHEACIRVVLAPDDTGTFEINLSGGVNGVPMTFVGGGTSRSGSPDQGALVCFDFTVP